MSFGQLSMLHALSYVLANAPGACLSEFSQSQPLQLLLLSSV